MQPFAGASSFAVCPVHRDRTQQHQYHRTLPPVFSCDQRSVMSSLRCHRDNGETSVWSFSCLPTSLHTYGPSTQYYEVDHSRLPRHMAGCFNRLLSGEWTDLCSSWHVVCIVCVVRLQEPPYAQNGMTTGQAGRSGRAWAPRHAEKPLLAGSRQFWIQLHGNLEQCKMGQGTGECVQGNGPSSRVVQVFQGRGHCCWGAVH